MHELFEPECRLRDLALLVAQAVLQEVVDELLPHRHRCAALRQAVLGQLDLEIRQEPQNQIETRAERGLLTLRPTTVVKISRALKVSPSRIVEVD